MLSAKYIALGFVSFFALKCLGPAQTILFEERFETPHTNGLPRTVNQGGVWTSVSAGRDSSAIKVVADTNTWFSTNANNRFLHVRDGVGFLLFATNVISSEVITANFDFIGHRTQVASAGAERLTIQFWGGDGAPSDPNRVHVLSLQNGQEIRSNAGVYTSGARLRWEVVINNSSNTIVYSSYTGSRSLPSGRVDVWINKQLAAGDYSFARQASTGPIRSLSFQTFSTDRFSVDLDNFIIVEGAHVNAIPVPPGGTPMVTVDDAGRLVYAADIQGNRIPDFSNAGYMGGGVPIPTVPVKITLQPNATGDDTARIQTAINAISGLPTDTNGFRGAILFKAGQYRIGGTLDINNSGIVLRGEGSETNGTVFIATGTGQRTLIRVAGTGTWQEVAGSRKTITDKYVPVGAISFNVTNVTGLQVGDSIIVHRPSTANWITAIGMDNIPPRSDGTPITQWKAGSFDLRYDRIITAIEGTRVTLDAPVANSMEEQFGGGSIYRYNFMGRIKQVGIEYIRGVSEYTSATDENHAWEMIVFDAIQNGWVRGVTALHFGFNAVQIGRYAKWITVEDSSLIDPISVITGSRRYPFYILGQLSLVQRCYGRNARHDFSTSSLTHGPNVFLQCSSTLSHSDSGPHHRWATGTLYDNVQVPSRDINVQNRLNLGTGHGWAGANHVLWNSSANRVCVQNPPTAQNWAIGVSGTKWAGNFPSYASDGYWISRNTPVNPNSLYLAQLQERLAHDGAGGGISVINLTTLTTQIPTNQSATTIPVRRVGNLDGSTKLKFLFESGADKLFNVSSFFPAASTQANVTFTLRTNAYVPTNRIVHVQLVHGDGYTAGVTNQLTISLPRRNTTYDSWRNHHFSEEHLSDPTVSAKEASANDDGVPNFVKYAFNLAPWSEVNTKTLVTLDLVNDRWTATWEWFKSISDVQVVAEISYDLQQWSGGEEFFEENIIDLGEFSRVTLTEKQFAPIRFLRIQFQAE